MSKQIKIGLPRALFFYDYYPFCKYFFEGLGAKIIVSEKTNKALLQAGLKHSVSELCIPMKLLFAHVLNIKDKVDYIFLPHMITLNKKTYLCPKLIAAPDIIQCSFENINLLDSEIDVNNFYSSLYESLKEVLVKINSNPMTVYSVYNDALKKQKLFEEYREKGFLFEEALAKLENKKYSFQKNQKLNIAVIGHPYIINEDYLNSNLFEKLNQMGAKVFTSDMVSVKEIEKELSVLEKIHHWTYANRVLGSALFFAKDKKIDGIIYVTPFGCSPDSLMKENLVTLMQNKKPLLTLTIDEHTGEAGLVTRIEAFLDLIERKNLAKVL